MMPDYFKAERQRLWVKFAIEINNLCNKWVTGHISDLESNFKSRSQNKPEKSLNEQLK
jgi:hypothetical protein